MISNKITCHNFHAIFLFPPSLTLQQGQGGKETDPCNNIQMVAYPSRWIAVLSTRQLDVQIASRHQSLAQDFPPIKK